MLRRSARESTNAAVTPPPPNMTATASRQDLTRVRVGFGDPGDVRCRDISEYKRIVGV